MSLDQEDIKMLRQIFDDIDTNKNGSIEVQEFLNALQKHNEIQISYDEVVSKLKEADVDQSGEITFDEFIKQIEKNL